MTSIEIQKVDPTEEKASICDAILHALPNWFGIESSIQNYINESKEMPFFVAFDNDKPIGFVAIKNHNPHAAEIYVMGILQKYQRLGIGKKLIKCCESFCKENKIEYLTVKTLDESAKSEDYEKTRHFYLALDFRPLDVFPLLWDKDNPCLLMAKYIRK